MRTVTKNDSLSAITTSPAEAPRAVILALHGFNDYSKAFEGPAQYFAKAGIITYAYDQRSFGDTPNRGIWPGTDALVGSRLPDDVKRWLRDVQRVHKVRPLLIRGHGRQRTSDGVRVFAGHVGRSGPFLETTVLEDVREIVDLPVSGLASGDRPGLTPYDEPLFLVCTHGKHDTCCAERGRPLCRALHDVAPDHTWEVSHIGGDRFAPNVLVLPEGLYFGRLTPADAPGFVETEMVAAMPDEVLQQVLARIPMGRLGQPEEIAGLALYLLTHGDYITGQVIGINGGLYM